MVRPTKPIALKTGVITKEQEAERLKAEKRLMGASDKLQPPPHLTKAQAEIFNNIVAEQKNANILCNIDVHILCECAVSLERLIIIDKMVNDDFELLLDRKLMSSRKDFTTSFFRCCAELGLSPTARSRLANINVNAKKDEEDPLLKVLSKKNGK